MSSITPVAHKTARSTERRAATPIRGFAGDGDYNDSFRPDRRSVVDNILYERFRDHQGSLHDLLAADGSPAA